MADDKNQSGQSKCGVVAVIGSAVGMDGGNPGGLGGDGAQSQATRHVCSALSKSQSFTSVGMYESCTFGPSVSKSA